MEDAGTERLTALSLEGPISETEFLRRELGVDWKTVEPGRMNELLRATAASPSRALVATSGPGPLIEYVSTAESDSIVVLLLGDENYTDDALALARHPAVHSIYKQNSWESLSLFQHLRLMPDFLWDAIGTDVRWRDIAKPVWRGIRARRQIRQWHRLGSKVKPLPLGYASVFAHALVRVAGIHSPTDSLLSWDPPRSESRSLLAGFSGDLGQPQRRIGLSRATTITPCVIRWTRGPWNGGLGVDQGEDYVRSLLAPRFALCPPGTVSNESFRVFESVICGSLPLSLHACVSQGTELPMALQVGLIDKTWKRLFESCLDTSEDRRLDLLEAARGTLRASAKSTSDNISRDIGRNG